MFMKVGKLCTIEWVAKVIWTVWSDVRSDPSWILKGRAILLSPVGVLLAGTASNTTDGVKPERFGVSTIFVWSQVCKLLTTSVLMSKFSKVKIPWKFL